MKKNLRPCHLILSLLRPYLLVSIFFLGLVSHAFAAPTVEGLFRNASNAEVSSELVTVALSLEGPSLKQTYTQLFFNTDPVSKKIDFLQALYRDASLADESITKVIRFTDLNQTLITDANPHRQLLYSLLEMFATNSSTGVSGFLKKYSPDYQSNNELLITDRINALDAYKNLLSENKNKKAAERVNDQQEKNKYNAALRAGLYQNDDKVSLIRENTDFFWHVQLENLWAWFTNESHQFSRLEFLSNEGPLTVVAGDFVQTHKSGNLFPSVLMLSYEDSDPYKIKLIKVNFSSKKDAYKNILQNLESKRQASSNVVGPVPFLY